MKIETILNAMEDAKDRSDFCYQVSGGEEGGKWYDEHIIRLRQYQAFRTRILRMFEQSELLVDRRTMQLEMAEQRIAELEAAAREREIRS